MTTISSLSIKNKVLKQCIVTKITKEMEKLSSAPLNAKHGSLPKIFHSNALTYQINSPSNAKPSKHPPISLPGTRFDNNKAQNENCMSWRVERC
jgi:hypothetical protein